MWGGRNLRLRECDSDFIEVVDIDKGIVYNMRQ